MDMKVYRCNVCGKIVAVIKDTLSPLVCCGAKMEELVPGTSDGAVEKHVPVVKVDGNVVTVTVGEVEHPMTEEHYIEWICISTKEGRQRKALKPGMKPTVEFVLTDSDEFVSAIAYCNLHGLWKNN